MMPAAEAATATGAAHDATALIVESVPDPNAHKYAVELATQHLIGYETQLAEAVDNVARREAARAKALAVVEHADGALITAQADVAALEPCVDEARAALTALTEGA